MFVASSTGRTSSPVLLARARSALSPGADERGRVEVADQAFYGALGGVELQLDAARVDHAEVGVSERVVADIVAGIVNPPHQFWVTFGVLTDLKEGGVNVVVVEDLQDLRRPFGVGAVIESQ